MGTASQSFKDGDPNESKLVKELNDFLERSPQRQLSADNKQGLEQAFKEAIAEAIFGRGADAVTKENVKKAVQSEVMNKMLRKYEAWKNAGSDITKWPFPKKPPQNP
jgi:hypothetical protein